MYLRQKLGVQRLAVRSETVLQFIRRCSHGLSRTRLNAGLRHHVTRIPNRYNEGEHPRPLRGDHTANDLSASA
jgi:hypothetical protein